MTCREVLEHVEAIAAGEPLDGAGRAHIETCPRCAAALADARRIETFLSSWPAPEAPPRFTRVVQHRLRRIHWQSEERIDRVFNGAMVVAALLLVVGLAGLLNVAVVAALAATLADVLAFAGSAAMEKAAPSMATYAAAMGLLATALGMWWWTEGTMDG